MAALAFMPPDADSAGMTVPGFIVRLLMTCTLVFGTYNPSGYSYLHWVTVGPPGDWDLKLFFGCVIFSSFVWYLAITDHAIGLWGSALVAAILRALAWVLVDYGIISLSDLVAITYALLMGVSIYLAIGMSYSGFGGRLSGQLDSFDLTR